MGIKYVTWVPNGNNPPEKITEQYNNIVEISNKDLMWQIRLCKTPGKVEVIAAFKEPEDVVAFMSLIYKNGKHKVVPKEVTIGFGKKGRSYSIEHNSSTEFKELNY